MSNLLLHFNGLNGATFFPDTSASYHDLTPFGIVNIDTSQSKFGGASAYFNGTSGYLSLQDSADWDFGAGDFTVDCWVRFDGAPTTQIIYGNLPVPSRGTTIYFGSGWHFAWLDGGGLHDNNFGGTVTTATWYHIAIVRNGVNLKFYVNGTQQGSTYNISTAVINNSTLPFEIGRTSDSPYYYFKGWLDEFRVLKGTAAWTSNFTPSVTAYNDDIYIPSPVAKMLLHCDGVDASTGFQDRSFSPHAITARGTAQVDTAYYEFPTGSLLLASSSDYLDSPYVSDWDFGSGDFTIDCWVRPTSVSGDRAIISAGGYPSGWAVYISSTTSPFGLGFACNTGGWAGRIATTAPTINVWSHIVIQRLSGVLYAYINGVQKTHATFTGAIVSNSSTFVVGKERTYGTIGNIDEIRIIKGIAAFPVGVDGNTLFTPSATPYTNESGLETVDVLNKINTTFGHYAIISNKLNYSKSILSNIINKINTCRLQTLDAFNSINFLGGAISNCNSKINTRKEPKLNVKNDIRFLKPWQKSASFGPQSLGKQYIKLYINNIEQTDVDIDSITISKKVGSSHSATFLLARPYDSSKPSKELKVVIKYADYPSLYEGYVTRVSPTDSPDIIQVECQDAFWNQNRDVSYFFVGHKPINDTITTYYDTMKQALSTEFGLNWNIGDFTPETISCYSIGKSEVLTSLIEISGNYSYFYDVDGNPRLWISGSGEIINLNLQQIGKNLGLYDVIRHQLTSSIEDLVNQYRVLMGVEGARENNFTGATVPYSIYSLSLVEDWCTPAWDGQYEVLAKDNKDGKGLNWFDETDEDKDKYKDIFRVWNLPYFTNTLQVWSDKYAPVITVYNNFNNFVNIYSENDVMVLTEGFSIDYEKRQVIFNDQLFLASYKPGTEKNKIDNTTPMILDKVKAPAIKISLGLKVPHVVTDVRNPLVFITDKMGTYPKTIQKNLILSQYSVELGSYYYDELGNLHPIPGRVMPSWDDTEYAMDYANWQLSKNCDEKITGQIDLTLDMICYYGIDLSKRVYSPGIMDNPLNIIGMTYKLSDFIVSLDVQNGRFYNRTVSLQKRWV